MNRRNFVKQIIGTAGAVVVAPLLKLFPKQEEFITCNVPPVIGGINYPREYNTLTLSEIRQAIERINQPQPPEYIYLHPSQVRVLEKLMQTKIQLKPRSLGMTIYSTQYIPKNVYYRNIGGFYGKRYFNKMVR